MAAVQRFAAILVADLRERTRSTRFWVVLVGMMVAAWLCVPPPDAGYMILSLSGGHRGSYSSAWVGLVLAMSFNLLLSLGGFYLVRGTLVRDIETRVWQLLVATPMTRAGFLLAKWASHMVVFSVIVGACLGVGLVAQFVRAEDHTIDLVQLIKPALLLSLPALAMTALAAIWFDLFPWLRRTAGNVLFFVLWIIVLGVSVAQMEARGPMARTGWASDPAGLMTINRDFNAIREQQTGRPPKAGFSLGSPTPEAGQVRFEWKSWSVGPMDVMGRGLWFAFAVGGVLLAAPLLDWSAARSSAAQVVAHAGMRLRWLDLLLGPFSRGAFGTLAVAELKLFLRERRVWWWLAALAALGMQSVGNSEILRLGILLGWLLPLDLLAHGPLREKEHRTGALVFTGAGLVQRLLMVRFAVALALLLALIMPGLLRLLPLSPLGALAAMVVSVSIVSWGLAIGALCRNARPFELLLVGALYLGLQGTALFDLGAGAATTLLWHGTGILAAWLTLAWAWPRLTRI